MRRPGSIVNLPLRQTLLLHPTAWSKEGKSVPLEDIPADLLVDGKATPIITHCGGGGRGQKVSGRKGREAGCKWERRGDSRPHTPPVAPRPKAKLYLEEKGFTNVINGGGPMVAPLWEMYGSI